MNRISIDDIIYTHDFVKAFNTFLCESNYGWEYYGLNPFYTDKNGRRMSRIEKALITFSYTIDGFEGDIVDLEDWFMSLDGADLLENDMDKPRTPYKQYSSQERLLGKINHLSKLDEFKKFDNIYKALEAYEKAKNELPNLLEKGVDLISLRSYIKLRLPESRDWLNKEEI